MEMAIQLHRMNIYKERSRCKKVSQMILKIKIESDDYWLHFLRVD